VSWPGLTDTALIVAAAVGPLVAGWVFYRLGQRSQQAHSEAEQSGRRVETALALSQEMDRVKKELESRFPIYVIGSAYWQRMSSLPTAQYDELRASGRVVEHGVALSSRVNREYEYIATINEGLADVWRLYSGPPTLPHDKVTFVLGVPWQRIWDAKTAFEKDYSDLIATLKKVAWPGP
jgi:hypothetical protein